jgi:hypothetical protein
MTDTTSPSSLIGQHLAQARHSATLAESNVKLKAAVDAALREDLAKIRSLSMREPNHPMVAANAHVLPTLMDSSEPEVWHCGGSIELSGAVMWALNSSVMFAPPLGFLFDAAGGPDLVVGAFVSTVFGSFVFDPNKIRNQIAKPVIQSVLGTTYDCDCGFQMASLTIEEGATRLSFYGQDGAYWGLVGGISVGASGASISGTGTMKWT